MTTIFEGSPEFGGIGGDYVHVTEFEDRILIRAVDRAGEEAATIDMTPEQARALATAIVAAADNAEAHQ